MQGEEPPVGFQEPDMALAAAQQVRNRLALFCGRDVPRKSEGRVEAWINQLHALVDFEEPIFAIGYGGDFAQAMFDKFYNVQCPLEYVMNDLPIPDFFILFIKT